MALIPRSVSYHFARFYPVSLAFLPLSPRRVSVEGADGNFVLRVLSKLSPSNLPPFYKKGKKKAACCFFLGDSEGARLSGFKEMILVIGCNSSYSNGWHITLGRPRFTNKRASGKMGLGISPQDLADSASIINTSVILSLLEFK